MVILKTNDASQFTNWQIIGGPIIFGTTKIGGLDTPTDLTFPTPIRASDGNRPKYTN